MLNISACLVFSKRKFSYSNVAKSPSYFAQTDFFSALTTVFLLTVANAVTQELTLCSFFTSQQSCEDAAF